MQRLPVNDDTLRLILSKGHEEWFARELRDRKIAIGVLVVLFFVAVAGFSSGIAFSMQEAASDVIYVSENTPRAEIRNLEAEGFTVVVGRFPSGDTDASPKEFKYPLLAATFAILGAIIVIAAPLFTLRAFYEMAKLRRWRTEHREFLASYGRDAV